MDALKKKRKSVKAKLTRVSTYCSSPQATADGIRARCEKIDDIFSEFENIQEQIEALMTEEQLANEEEYRAQIEEVYYTLKALYVEEETNNETVRNVTPAETSDQFRVVLDSLARNQEVLGSLVASISSSTPTERSAQMEAANQHTTVPLPSIKLPDFDGTYTEWLRFRDLFESLIHNRTNISNIEKFEYLQSHVKGEAGSIIKHLSASNENYVVAWDLIKNKFNNSNLIKRNYLQLLLDQPPMKGLSSSELKRIINNTNEGVNALTAMNEPVESWDTVLVFQLEKKLDMETQTLWCRAFGDSPTYANLMKFLDSRLREVENCSANNIPPASHSYKQRSTYTAITKMCPLCQQRHYIYQCDQFKALNTNDRINIVKRSNMCFNCLHYDHTVSNCKRSKCRYCNNKHNTLLHQNFQHNNNQNATASDSTIHLNTKNITTIATMSQGLVTILPTAIVMLQDANNEQQPCRILIDTGAQATLITEDCVRRLNLRRKFDKTLLNGIGKENRTYTRGKVQIIMSSRHNSQSIATQALCVTKLTQLQPAVQLSDNELQFFKQLNLADTQCNIPGKIDIILGADNYSKCIMKEKIDHPTATLSAISTIFGWVMIGNMSAAAPTTITISHLSIDHQLQKFWLMEEIEENDKAQYTQEEQQAEEHFQRTFSRNESGRYVVRLPVKDSIKNLENIKGQAIKRLYNMESKLSKNKQLHKDYHAFMNEYKDLSHMEVLKNENAALYHLPHHAVIKQQSTTTKLRVVFDGSAKCSNGTSLNDHLLIGPTMQNDIFSILLHFRKYQVAIAGDIEKMYRQIVVHPFDRAYQCIVWRSNKDEKIAVYQLKTVTYGTSAAPFLATRTLHQIALDNEDEHPEVAKYIKNNFYIDDFMTCTPDVNSAIQLKISLCSILKQAGFNLRKWSSNSIAFLNTIDNSEKAISSETIIDNIQTVKTLGLMWKTDSDHFKYNISTPELQLNITKRLVLSIISRIFDPLGLVAPFTITLKIFMQKVWTRGSQWDAVLPEDLQQQWNDLYAKINKLQDIQISRWLQFKPMTQVQLHGFADASECAFAAAVYLLVIHENGTVTTRLIAAKTKVSPIKQVTIPRLELCACHLLARLIKKVSSILNITNIESFGWTDSTIVLSWLADHPRRWKNFVANRTTQIINILPPQQWRHIPSRSNPADCATRGMTPTQLKDADLWWYGPTDYMKNVNKQQQAIHATDLEKRNINILHVSKVENDYLQRYSSLTKLTRITALILRFIHNCNSKNLEKRTGFIKFKELENAHDALVKRSQQLSYKREIEILKKGQQLPIQHKLCGLAPFIDEKGLFRVGGRLVNAKLSYNQKHPLIIHKDSFLTALIVRYYHLHFLHAGSRQLQYLLGLRYWIPTVVYIIKQIVYKCPTCMRHRSKPYVQQMGNLPRSRLETMSAFHNVGVDFAGPFFVKSWKGRGSKQYKVWISLFVCLSTKAMHLELVTELSTDAFIATLRRFVARRGLPANIYSDNGTNFVGCNNKLRELFQFMNNKETHDVIARETANNGIQWHFSPPSGPHFGGIWEAGVKITKYHLYRVLGNASVTYEEMTTILCQIESCLNSRPLTAKFEGDIDPLTPGHFLIMKPMNALPDNDYNDININRLTRWQYLQKLTQAFWKKWSTDYLTQMQSRPKWKIKAENLKENDIVLIKEETAPNKWSIGKIINTHPGDDGLVRVVTLKTQKGMIKRPITKLCPLLVDS